jgi:hypothetical protein
MNALIERLEATEREELRLQFQKVEATRWVTDVAHQLGWQEANEQYLAKERAHGREEMRALQKALGIGTPLSRTQAVNVLEVALTLVAPEGEEESVVQRIGEHALRLRVANCSDYLRLEASGWRGVTACTFRHRRQGWYEALGVGVVDTVLADRKWGDEACASCLELTEDWDQLARHGIRRLRT